MRLLLLGLFTFPFLPLLARGAETAAIDETRALAATGEVLIENVNGPITIETWDKAEVRLQAVKSARSAADLAALEVDIEATPTRFAAKTVYRDKEGSWLKKFTNTGEVRYTVTVPHTARLRQIETVNGAIAITNAHGRVSAKTVNGRLVARGLRDEVELSVVNGELEAEFDALSPRQDIALSSTNGRIELRLPDTPGAEIDASTVNGSITNDFGLTNDAKKWVGQKLQGTIGDGAARVRVETVNGAISLRKR